MLLDILVKFLGIFKPLSHETYKYFFTYLREIAGILFYVCLSEYVVKNYPANSEY